MVIRKIPEVSITLPIYNEEERIRQTVKNLVRVFESKKVDYQLVLVNHGSWDKSEEIINKLGEENERIKPINLIKNLGYGGGIMYGFSKSNGEYIGWTCADEEVTAEETYKVFKALKNSGSLVSKAIRRKRKDGKFRILTTKIFNFLIKVRFNLKIKDVNGFPFFMKKEVFENIKVKEKNHLFNLDLLKNIKDKNYKIIEVPVTHQKRKSGKSFMKMSRVIEMALDTLKYCLVGGRKI